MSKLRIHSCHIWEETAMDLLTIFITADYEISTLPDPTMEYEQHTPPIEPTLELFPSHELSDTTPVTGTNIYFLIA